MKITAKIGALLQLKALASMESAYKDDREEFDRIFEFIVQQKEEKVAILLVDDWPSNFLIRQ